MRVGVREFLGCRRRNCERFSYVNGCKRENEDKRFGEVAVLKLRFGFVSFVVIIFL